MKLRALAVSAFSLLLLSTTHQALSEPAASCARATISIRTGTDTVAPGTTIGIAGGASNCSSRKMRYIISFSAMSDCGQRVEIASRRIAFNPGENILLPVSYPMPVSTCTGPWVATMDVSDNSGKLASTSTTIIVQ